MADQNYQQYLSKLEVTLDEYLVKKAPALPPQIKEVIVKIAPYLTIISLLITIPGLFVLFGLGGFASMLAPMGGYSAMRTMPLWWVSVVLLIPVVILEGMSIPGLFAKSTTGWKYMYWAQLISVLSNLVTFNIIGGIIGAVIGFYILFQVRSYYH